MTEVSQATNVQLKYSCSNRKIFIRPGSQKATSACEKSRLYHLCSETSVSETLPRAKPDVQPLVCLVLHLSLSPNFDAVS